MFAETKELFESLLEIQLLFTREQFITFTMRIIKMWLSLNQNLFDYFFYYISKMIYYNM